MNVGDVLALLQVGEEVEDRGLHGDVEGGGRLVADDHAGRRRRPCRSPRAASGRPSCAGRALRRRSSKRTDQASSPDQSSQRSPRAPTSFVIARPMIRRTEKRRFSAASGFWKTIWIARTCSVEREPMRGRERLRVELEARAGIGAR